MDYLLTNVNIDIISDEIGLFLEKCKVDRKDAMRIKFAAEEILLNYQERFGEEQEVALDCRKRFGRPRIVLNINSARFNPMEEKVEQGGERWSKPHVATLSLHSLFELRTCMEKGSIMLDREASSLPQLVGKYVVLSS